MEQTTSEFEWHTGLGRRIRGQSLSIPAEKLPAGYVVDLAIKKPQAAVLERRLPGAGERVHRPATGFRRRPAIQPPIGYWAAGGLRNAFDQCDHGGLLTRAWLTCLLR